MNSVSLFAQSAMQSDADGGSGAGLIIGIIAFLVSIVAFWRVFEKANYPGWAAIIPIYNLYILLKVAGRPVGG